MNVWLVKDRSTGCIMSVWLDLNRANAARDAYRDACGGCWVFGKTVADGAEFNGLQTKLNKLTAEHQKEVEKLKADRHEWMEKAKNQLQFAVCNEELQATIIELKQDRDAWMASYASDCASWVDNAQNSQAEYNKLKAEHQKEVEHLKKRLEFAQTYQKSIEQDRDAWMDTAHRAKASSDAAIGMPMTEEEDSE